MSADLNAFVEEITDARDEAYRGAIAAHAAGDYRTRAERGSEWFAYARALSVLYCVTGGEHGTPIDEQPSPYAAVNSEPAAVRGTR